MVTTRKTPSRSADSKTTTRQTATRKTATTPPVSAKATAPVKSGTPVKVKTVAQPSSKTAAKPASKPVPTPKTDKKVKTEKIKVVRDSFTIPKSEYLAIADMKKRALGLGQEAKKSELIRAGLALLAALPDASFQQALARVPTLKTGRPGKN